MIEEEEEEEENAAALLPSHMRDVYGVRPEPQDGSARQAGPDPSVEQ
jgi:hypothetical protein